MPTDRGWVKTHRKLLNNPVVCKDSDHMAVWFFLLLNAAHSEQTAMFSGKKITLLPGQLLTSKRAIAKALKIDPSKVYRILKRYEIEQQIEPRTDRQQSLITIRNWHYYQSDNEPRNEPRMNHERTTRQENKDEKEKSIKKEKEENKESLKNERSSSNARACEDDNDDLPSTEIRLFGWRKSKVLMLSDAQFDSICERCSSDEIDFYMDRMVELVNKGYSFGCSHYEYIMQMVDKDRKLR